MNILDFSSGTHFLAFEQLSKVAAKDLYFDSIPL